MTDVIIFHFGLLFALLSPYSLKKEIFKKMKKKTPGYIIILQKRTKNYDHMVYCPREIAHDRCNYFSFWASFCPFTPLKTQKIKISKKWKKHLEILSFYTCVPKIMIRWYTVPEIWCATDGQPDSRMDGRKTLQIEVCSLPKNDHFLVFLAVWVIFPKFLGR